MKRILLTALFLFTSATANSANNVQLYPAPEISGISKWFNSPPLQISQQKGKVVLIDFWTYSCINCIRTLPHMNELQKKYADKGLVIIGIHAPEFFFEKNEKNVEAAIKRFEIQYPVAMDNDLKTWHNFENQYWPAHYLINQDGQVVYTHFGEGSYDVMENNIRALLKISNEVKNNKKSAEEFTQNQTPETYLGSNRGEGNANQNLKILTFPKKLPDHSWALSGNWKILGERSESATKNDALRLNFYAKKVFLVMDAKDGKDLEVTIKLDGKEITADEMGVDVKDGIVNVKESRLYELVKLKKARTAVLEITPKRGGLRIYAFTFG